MLKDVFGDTARRLPVSSIKGALGHSLGAASAIEAAVSVRALREQIIPPTINFGPTPSSTSITCPTKPGRPGSIVVLIRGVRIRRNEQRPGPEEDDTMTATRPAGDA